MQPRPLTTSLTTVALAGLALLAAGCSSGSGTEEAAESPAMSSPSSSVAEVPDESVPSEPATAPAPSKPNAADMDTDRLADSVLEQLKIDSPDTFSDQLVTIALSPLMRQLSSTADVTTRVGSKGDRVTLTLTGDDGTCVITVTDVPRARGVVCKPA